MIDNVLAAEIRAGAQVIVTRNTKDFPDAKLASWIVSAEDPTSSYWG